MSAEIQEVQALLASHGFDPGPADGQWGAQSRKALLAALQAGIAAAASQPPGQCDDDAALFAELDQDEGVVSYAYQDSLGLWTIGRGRMIDKRRGGGLAADEINYLTRNDLKRSDALLDKHLPWWRGQDPVRRRVLRNLMFNMGWDNPQTPEHEGLSGFVNTLAAWQAGDYDRAALGVATSKWAKQVQPARSQRIIRQIRTGA